MLSRLRAFLSERRAARAAEALAVDFATGLHPGAEFMGSSVAAREPARIVVRVFLGRQSPDAPAAMGVPPWERCVVVAVPRDGGTDGPCALEGTAAAAYRPTLR